jgi:hypothetical protein
VKHPKTHLQEPLGARSMHKRRVRIERTRIKRNQKRSSRKNESFFKLRVKNNKKNQENKK